ncbi:MAG: ThuA domain-containing protein [Bacteroidetes bacterium]|nr:MAG: ThuA domain-containing protein [Bacteroidota bacterium]
MLRYLPFLLLLCLPTWGQAQTEPSLAGKNVLFVYGGWKGHEPVKCRDYVVPWMESEGATVVVSDSLGVYADSMLMDSMDLVVQIWTMGQIAKPHLKGLLQAVRNGCGFAGWHGGMGDAFRQETEYQFMVGGQWVAHPGGFVDYEVHIVDREDPVTQGVEDFAMHSEQYYMHVDPNVKVLATTTFNGDHNAWIDGAVMPVVWKKTYGQGRIFYTSLGHLLDHLRVPGSWTMLTRGLRWAAESKYQPEEAWRSPVYDRP